MKLQNVFVLLLSQCTILFPMEIFINGKKQILTNVENQIIFIHNVEIQAGGTYHSLFFTCNGKHYNINSCRSDTNPQSNYVNIFENNPTYLSPKPLGSIENNQKMYNAFVEVCKECNRIL